MVLVEPDSIITQPVELLPSLEVLGIGPHRNLRLEIFLRQRIWQLAADFQMLQLLAIRQEVEYENLHLVR